MAISSNGSPQLGAKLQVGVLLAIIVLNMSAVAATLCCVLAKK